MQNHFFLQENYIKKGLSLAQIARLTFSSKSGVQAALKRQGIPLRAPHKNHGKTAQIRYGKRLWGGRIKDHLIEKRVIKAILQFHEQGMTLRDIADTLTNLGIPTKCQAKSWHPEMVKRILAHSKK